MPRKAYARYWTKGDVPKRAWYNPEVCLRVQKPFR